MTISKFFEIRRHRSREAVDVFAVVARIQVVEHVRVARHSGSSWSCSGHSGSGLIGVSHFRVRKFQNKF